MAILDEDICDLPMRSLVALVVRCARRVESWTVLPDDMDNAETRTKQILHAYEVAEQFCGNATPPNMEHDGSNPEYSPACTAEAAEERGNEQMSRAIHAVDQLWAITFRGVQVAKSTEAGAPTEEEVLGQLLGGNADNLGEQALALMFGGGDAGADEALGFAEDAIDHARAAAEFAGRDNDFDRACRRDIARLVELHAGGSGTCGSPVDSTPDGPLGAYW